MTYEEAAQAIIAESRARGHTRYECIAELATAIQESGLRMVWSGNRLWFGYYQQDSSYPNRMNPTGNIKGFFDRLDVKRVHPGHGDIWMNIFWLQQAPGRNTAKEAYDRGRQAYMTEIKSKTAEATRLVNIYWPDGNGGTTVPDFTGDPVWLADVLKADLGDRLKVWDGWETRGTGAGVGGTDQMGTIWGVMIHHTGNVNEKPEIIRDGVEQPTGWLPGPLSQCLIDKNGICHLVAIGPCNHAGARDANGMGPNNANQVMIGFECAYGGSGDWPQKQIITMRDATAAVLRRIGKRGDRCIGHKEYAPSRKPDPGNLHMPWFRDEVNKDLDGFVFPGEGVTTLPPVVVVPPDYDKEIWDQLRINWKQLGNQTLVNALGEVRDEVLHVTDYADWKAAQAK